MEKTVQAMATIDLNDCNVIVEEKALRYKRNVLVISFVLTMVAIVQGLHLKEIPVLNVSLGGEKQIAAPEFKAWCFAFLIYGYNIVAWVYYGYADFIKWRELVLIHTKLPNLDFIVLDHAPNAYLTGTLKTQTIWRLESKNYDAQNEKTDFLYRSNEAESEVKSYYVYDIDKARMQRLYKLSMLFEFSVPATAACFGGMAVLYNLVAEWPY